MKTIEALAEQGCTSAHAFRKDPELLEALYEGHSRYRVTEEEHHES